MPSISIASVLFIGLVGLAHAHPGHDIHHEARLRRHYLSIQENSLDHCAEVFKAEGLHRRAVERRAARVAELNPHHEIYGKLSLVVP